MAVIIPAGFTAAVFAPEGQAAIELYQDPTLTLGPGIVKGIVRQLVDGFAGSKIAAEVVRAATGRAWAARGRRADAARHRHWQYSEWATALGESQQQATNALPGHPVTWRRSRVKPTNLQTAIISLIMAGMMVFYVFFTGAASAQSILQEEEAGTLPRLFTTPTPQSVDPGRQVSWPAFVTLVLQVVVLVVVSALVFGIDWGQPLPRRSWYRRGLVVLAASFGIFLTSLLKDTRQGGHRLWRGDDRAGYGGHDGHLYRRRARRGRIRLGNRSHS